MRAVKTWKAELGVVAAILGGTVVLTGGAWREVLGACAVLAGFAHGQVSDRLAEYARATENGGYRIASKAHCWRWSARYFVAKECLWFVYFASLHAWTALVGVVVFLVYPFWRRAWRGG